MVGP
jgi:hypothetical protein